MYLSTDLMYLAGWTLSCHFSTHFAKNRMATWFEGHNATAVAHKTLYLGTLRGYMYIQVHVYMSMKTSSAWMQIKEEASPFLVPFNTGFSGPDVSLLFKPTLA